MAKTKSVNPNAFLDNAERIMREYAGKNPQLSVWRGSFPKEMLGQIVFHETILVGFSDDVNSSEPPTIPVMKVQINSGSAEIHFETGSDDDTSCSIPFFGHSPIKEVEILSRRLPNIHI